MDDLISRQAAIDATWEEPTYTDPINVLTEVRDRIKQLPSAQQWIPVDERLPEVEKDVLISYHYDGDEKFFEFFPAYDGVMISYWTGVKNHNVPRFAVGEGMKVLAWMPLPEPWEGDRR